VAALQDLSTVPFLPGPITKPQAPFDQHYPAITGVSFRDTLFSPRQPKEKAPVILNEEAGAR